MSIKTNIIVPNEPINRFSYFTPIASSVVMQSPSKKLSVQVLPKKIEALTPEEELKQAEELKKKMEEEKKKTRDFYTLIAIYGFVLILFILFYVRNINYDYKKTGGVDDSDELTENSIYVQ